MPKVVNPDAFKLRCFGDRGPGFLEINSWLALNSARKDVRVACESRQARKDFQGSS